MREAVATLSLRVAAAPGDNWFRTSLNYPEYFTANTFHYQVTASCYVLRAVCAACCRRRTTVLCCAACAPKACGAARAARGAARAVGCESLNG